ncbi:MAG: hypothetical protein GX915_08510, partial [Clostridiales bacterium]|nr:hypothetical protein [Clostridiales bacterium]
RFEVPALKDMFPGYNTSQAGFKFTFDTTYVTNGAHKIAIKATGTDGTIHIVGPITVTVNNAPKYKASLWSPSDGAIVSGTMQVSGWCINEKGISTIELLINGIGRGYPTRFEVPALKDMFPGYNTSEAGFVYPFDTTGLANGTYEIAIKVTGTDGTTHIVGPVTVTVNNVVKAINEDALPEVKPDVVSEEEPEVIIEEPEVTTEEESDEDQDVTTEEESNQEQDVVTEEESDEDQDVAVEEESDEAQEAGLEVTIPDEEVITGTIDGLSSDPISGVQKIEGTIVSGQQAVKLEILLDSEIFDSINFDPGKDVITFEYDFDTTRFEDGKYLVTFRVVTESGKKYIIKDVEVTIINSTDEDI